ncbi:MAG: membrane integrity-associated transporter subunit PqiC [Deltaproteobacteria bacterium]|nr:membrane integrity-associated transporter subunit PqiC [Deltaproteobacteria bacterium]MBV8454508.1 membrane integrity-associated transporter subunit PqiC [Deltaproteobacteria bacterium]
MMPDRKACLLVIALAAVLPGCGTSASRFYRLDTTAAPNNASAVQTAVMVGPVSVPAAVDRPEFVVQVAPNRVEVEEFDRWAAPLDDSIARAVAGDLSVLLATPDVATAPLADFNPAYNVTINVQRFESLKGDAAVVDAVWAVRRAAGGKTRSGRTIAREAVQGEGFDALAAAHSRAIAKLSSDIAAAIRMEASGNM